MQLVYSYYVLDIVLRGHLKMMENEGLKLIKVCPFMDYLQQPTIDDWNITIVAKRI